jgi:hypothetical protein
MAIPGLWRGSLCPTLSGHAGGEWKLFAEPDGSRVELYHILEDPEERTNLAADHPEVVKALLPKLLDWKATLPE